MDKAQKEAAVKELVSSFGETTTMFVADYRGLDMPEITELRGKLREANAEFTVVKNTLAKRAAAEAGLEGVDDLFSGPSAVAFAHGRRRRVGIRTRDRARGRRCRADLG